MCMHFVKKQNVLMKILIHITQVTLGHDVFIGLHFFSYFTQLTQTIFNIQQQFILMYKYYKFCVYIKNY